jgi:hypothetical protein
MDDDLQHLEAELHNLRPVPASPALTRRVGATLDRRRGVRLTLAWLAVALPAAAAVAWGVMHVVPPAATGPTPLVPAVAAAPAEDASFKPVAAEKVLVSALDEGLVTLADGTPARRERIQFVDTITWRNPRTNASLTWTVPREEVRVVPVVWQ